MARPRPRPVVVYDDRPTLGDRLARVALAVVLALALAVLAGGCRSTAPVTFEPELVTVELPPPPPSVVTRTDTVYADPAAPTIAEARDSLGTPAGATTTAPRRVAPVERDVPLGWEPPRFFALRLDSAEVFLQLSTGDVSFLAPAKGEQLAVYTRPDGRIGADLTGAPIPERIRVPTLRPTVVRQVNYPTWRVMLLALLATAALFPVAYVLRPLLHKG